MEKEEVIRIIDNHKNGMDILIRIYEAKKKELDDWYISQLKDIKDNIGSPIYYNIDEKIFNICLCLNIDYNVFISKHKGDNMPTFRHITTYILRNEYRYSFKKIGNAVNRDHATCIHSDKKVKEWLSLPNMFKEEIEILEKAKKCLTN